MSTPSSSSLTNWSRARSSLNAWSSATKNSWRVLKRLLLLVPKEAESGDQSPPSRKTKRGCARSPSSLSSTCQTRVPQRISQWSCTRSRWSSLVFVPWSAMVTQQFFRRWSLRRRLPTRPLLMYLDHLERKFRRPSSALTSWPSTSKANTNK